MNNDLGMRAKGTLEKFVQEIGPRLEKYFDEEYARNFGFNLRQKQVVVQILDHAKEFLLRPQKRLRPSFVCYGYKLSGGELSEKVWRVAMGVEILHAGILMHDDFMDEDSVRRGGETTHVHFRNNGGGDVHYGDAMAVTVGDAVWSMGYELVTGANNDRINSHLFRAITNTAYGQAYDLVLEKFENWNEEDVIALHRAKTGLYTYENPLFIGAMLGGIDNPEIFKVLEDYSMDGGVAFQLQDDILGVFGSPEKTGKSSDSDIKQGKCTLVVLKAFEMGNPQQVKAVKKVWGDVNATRSDLDLAKQAIVDSGAYEYNKKVAQEYAKKAAEMANNMRQFNLNVEAIDYIQGIAEYMVVREV